MKINIKSVLQREVITLKFEKEKKYLRIDEYVIAMVNAAKFTF
jgi:hypothetical protein